MAEKTAEQSRNLIYAIVCAIVGMLLAVPVSYFVPVTWFFQTDMTTGQHGMSQYISKELFVDSSRAITVIGTVVLLGVAGFLFGLFAAGMVSGVKAAKPAQAASKAGKK